MTSVFSAPIRPLLEAKHYGDEADFEEIYTTERHLLYVACTRARDHIMTKAVDPGSEFLDDLQPSTDAED